MQDTSTVRICGHPLCDRRVGDPAFALSRKEREAREYGFCMAQHPMAIRDPMTATGWRLSSAEG